MCFKKWIKSIQTPGYDGACTVRNANSDTGACTIKFIALSGRKFNRICFRSYTTQVSDIMDFIIVRYSISVNTLPSRCGQHDIDHHSSITHHQVLRPCFRKEIRKPHIIKILFPCLGAIFILRKDIGVGGWSRKWQFSLTLCSENVLT